MLVCFVLFCLFFFSHGDSTSYHYRPCSIPVMSNSRSICITFASTTSDSSMNITKVQGKPEFVTEHNMRPLIDVPTSALCTLCKTCSKVSSFQRQYNLRTLCRKLTRMKAISDRLRRGINHSLTRRRYCWSSAYVSVRLVNAWMTTWQSSRPLVLRTSTSLQIRLYPCPPIACP